MEVTVLNSESLERITRAEVDTAISTAKTYPRDIVECKSMVMALATSSKETAESCFYALPRAGKSIQGYSVRLAEIVANSWGNLNCGTRIVGNDGKMITAQAVVHDLQRNVRIQTEVKRKITDKFGKTYTEDMQVVTGNAASAIALRNAIFKVIPEAMLKKEFDEIKKVAIGNALDLETRRENVIKYFSKLGVSEKQLLDMLAIKTVDEISNDDLFTLKGLKQALEEGTTTIAEVFSKRTTVLDDKFDIKKDDKPKEEAEKPKKSEKVEFKISGLVNGERKNHRELLDYFIESGYHNADIESAIMKLDLRYEDPEHLALNATEKEIMDVIGYMEGKKSKK